MDAKDHAKITQQSGQESHGVHLCHKCGWPFPNHIRVRSTDEPTRESVGKLKGISLFTQKVQKMWRQVKMGLVPVESGKDQIEWKMKCFQMQLLNFQDSGISPGIEQVLEDARESITNVEKVAKDGFDAKQPLEDNSITGQLLMV
ncbi:hypothetical protein CK203_052571 [Vitis vinifera]|uniref:Uncharacterized protein n=1 Tax=Vitis vinifera TaxID=29760 RepID=A0A438FW41_VITVI|nr:hypothetical protein CK203_052571 [Vitis vinifera]